MKKKISVLFLFLVMFSLSSCFKSNEDDISKVKQELLNNEKSLEEQFEENIAKFEEIEQELEEQKEEKFIINYL